MLNQRCGPSPNEGASTLLDTTDSWREKCRCNSCGKICSENISELADEDSESGEKSYMCHTCLKVQIHAIMSLTPTSQPEHSPSFPVPGGTVPTYGPTCMSPGLMRPVPCPVPMVPDAAQLWYYSSLRPFPGIHNMSPAMTFQYPMFPSPRELLASLSVNAYMNRVKPLLASPSDRTMHEDDKYYLSRLHPGMENGEQSTPQSTSLLNPTVGGKKSDIPLDAHVLNNQCALGKPQSCSQCNKSFRCKSELDTHIRIHTGEKPYQCSFCEKRFLRNETLNRHTRIHTDGKSYQCSYCDKSFGLKDTLQRHTRIHTGEKPFKCTFCEKSFNQQGPLISHTRIHTGEKPYQCKFCDKSFTRKGLLVDHTRIHTGEKYQCKFCDKSFTQKHPLVVHTRNHSGKKPYECSFCDKSFAQNEALQRHTKVHTG